MNNCFTVETARYVAARDSDRLGRIAAYNRINALACIQSAEHGWLGASYSVCEILTALYFGIGEFNVVLSKGHAAAMQYACLFGLGRMDESEFLSYKKGPGHLQAHTDRCTPGILVNTGSLGQALSKVAAMALCRPQERFFVVLGDGELQEGQCWEGFQTVLARRLENLTIIVDCNGYQSSRPVEEIKVQARWEDLFRDWGFAVDDVEGHDVDALVDCLGRRRGGPRLLLARTVKGGGSRHLRPRGGRQPWHGKVPDGRLYELIVEEQAERSGDLELMDRAHRWRREGGATASSFDGPAARAGDEGLTSTGEGFGRALARRLKEDPRIRILDADLAASCAIEGLEGHEQFLEMGIAEQDMVSFAGGLALEGLRPVVNSYAAFLKRALEQIHVNATEGSSVLYAGHYGGLCYCSDGKTHQSLDDLGALATVAGMRLIEPATAAHAEAALDWALAQEGPVYVRLHRTPLRTGLEELDWQAEGMVQGEIGDRVFVAMGTAALRLVQALRRCPVFADWALVAPAVLGLPDEDRHWRDLLGACRFVAVVEEDREPGMLFARLCRSLAPLEGGPRIWGRGIRGLGASFRRLDDCLTHFAFTESALKAELLEQLPSAEEAR